MIWFGMVMVMMINVDKQNLGDPTSPQIIKSFKIISKLGF